MQSNKISERVREHARSLEEIKQQTDDTSRQFWLPDLWRFISDNLFIFLKNLLNQINNDSELSYHNKSKIKEH